MTSPAILIAALAALVAAGCGSAASVAGDGLRIRPDRHAQYRTVPRTSVERAGSTLRGRVVEMQIIERAGDSSAADTVILFHDRLAPDGRDYYERIPLASVEQIRFLPGLRLQTDTLYDNVNLVETYNEAGEPLGLRRFPVRRLRADGTRAPVSESAPEQCDCEPFSLAMPSLDLACPERSYSWYFMELRGLYSGFYDRPTPATERGRDVYSGELALGVRFGGGNEWGVGALVSAGVPAYNSFNGEERRDPMALLHLRYQTPGSLSSILGLCMKPYLYGQLGMAISEASSNLAKMELGMADDCGCAEAVSELEARGELPGINLALPLTLGLGIGAEIPMTPFMDLAIDIGYRSIAIGEEAEVASFENVPSMRRIGALFLRAGVTF